MCDWSSLGIKYPASPETATLVSDLIECLQWADQIIILAGAGVSTASGLADYCGSEGLYRNSKTCDDMDDPTISASEVNGIDVVLPPKAKKRLVLVLGTSLHHSILSPLTLLADLAESASDARFIHLNGNPPPKTAKVPWYQTACCRLEAVCSEPCLWAALNERVEPT
ncbi:hypothetical protein BJ741DRAFT_684406 [Chytriomyces cf. hyalinus JEL632]|nr:hypothetical protein BJ741DRAFT_684406 [Chytriomyces cf. hyalinus JEL632]